MSAARISAILIAIAGAACGSDPVTTPTSATTTAPTTILFAGTLQPKATRFYSYTLTTAGTVSAMLASLEQNGAPQPNALELGLGIPAGTGCAVDAPSTTTTSLVPQIKLDASIGTYCVRIADTIGLPAPMNFTIRVVHP
jgi:hypothetical protein